MPQNFIESRREQGFLLPPDVRDWLAEDHLAWFVIDAVARMDLAGFYRAYRADGHGRAAYEPSMMVTLVLYAFATKQRSSRAIECHCRQDVAYRVITGNVVPDHATIARFIARHERALAGLFGEVLALCDQAGLVAPGVIAIDGTRLAGNAGDQQNMSFEEIAQEVIAETVARDAAEDERHGEERGDELPEQLRTVEGRRAFFEQAKRTLEEKRRLRDEQGEDEQGEDEQGEDEREEVSERPEAPAAAADASPELALEPSSPSVAQSPGSHAAPENSNGPEAPEVEKSASRFVFDAERIVARSQGREGWPREARRQLEAQRWQQSRAIPRDREERLMMGAERLEEDLEAECCGHEAYLDYRAHGRTSAGRRLGRRPKPYEPPEVPEGKVNVTDPDSKRIRTTAGYCRGTTRRPR